MRTDGTEAEEIRRDGSDGVRKEMKNRDVMTMADRLAEEGEMTRRQTMMEAMTEIRIGDHVAGLDVL